jgi:mono/diheme cytochrome c family protein
MKNLKNIAILGAFVFGLFAFTTVQDEWVIPAEYQKMTNPTDPEDEDGLEIGEELYMRHCKSCHGKEGLGDGPKAAEQKGDLGDFSSAKFQGQKDGVLFYKSKIGKDDMPDFSKKIPNDEDIWYIVNYMRTLGE